MREPDRLSDELRIVATLSAQRDLAPMFYEQEHMHVSSWWLDQKFYHLFMLLLFLEWDAEEKDFWARIKAKGREIIKEEEKFNKFRQEQNKKIKN